MALLCFTWRAVPSSGTCKPQVGRRFHRILLDLSPAHQWSPHFHQSLCLTALTLHYQRVRVHLCTAPVGVHLPITTLSTPRVQCLQNCMQFTSSLELSPSGASCQCPVGALSGTPNSVVVCGSFSLHFHYPLLACCVNHLHHVSDRSLNVS